MYLDSPRWKEGVCEVHRLPQTPCPACIAEGHDDMFVHLQRADIECGGLDPDMPLIGFVPEGAPVVLHEEKIRGAGLEGLFRGCTGQFKDPDEPAWGIELLENLGVVEACRADEFSVVTQRGPVCMA